MATTTMNGWSLTGVPLATITAGGRSTQVRTGAVATVLGHVARRFHAEVEPLVTFHGWRSVATNAAVGGHPRSNHPSGTAFDANGYRHPYRAPVNFTAAQVAAIRRILAEVAPVVRWGGDFGAALRDGMHFEIVGAAAQVTAVAARLTTPPTPAPAPLTPLPLSEEDDMFDDTDRARLGNIEALLAIDTSAGPGGIRGALERANAAIAAVRVEVGTIQFLLATDTAAGEGGMRGALERANAELTAIQTTLAAQTGGTSAPVDAAALAAALVAHIKP